jgi:propanediol dehydratase large subunit
VKVLSLEDERMQLEKGASNVKANFENMGLSQIKMEQEEAQVVATEIQKLKTASLLAEEKFASVIEVHKLEV